jgi:hypothetical protein
MAWKPWYERLAEIESAQEREEFLRGVLGPSQTKSTAQKAGAVLGGLLLGWGIHKGTGGGKK